MFVCNMRFLSYFDLKLQGQFLLRKIVFKGRNNWPHPSLYNFLKSDASNYSTKFSIEGALQKLKTSGSKIPSNAYLKTIGSGAVGAPVCLLACISGKKYIFNYGESVDRVALNSNKTLNESSILLITSKSFKNISGLNSLVLKQRDLILKKKDLAFSIYAPNGLAPLLDEISRNTKSRASYFDVKNDHLEFDSGFQIQTVAIFPSEIDHEYSNYVVSYICKLAPIEGFISFDTLVDAGIPPGPWLRQLLDGQSTTLPDGKKVSPNEFKREGSYKGTTFIVIDIPSASYLDSLVSCSAFHQHQAGAGKLEEDMPAIIVHFSPPQVMKDPRYKQWVNSFSPSAAHLVLNENNMCLGLKRPVLLQLQLNYLLPKVFPLLHDSGPGIDIDINNPIDHLPSHLLADEYGFNGPTVQSDSQLSYHLRPHSQFISELGGKVDPDKLIISTFHENEELQAAIVQMIANFKQVKTQSMKKPQPYPQVIILGTSSPPVTSTRGTSAILIYTDPESCILLDCGDGTFDQMIRLMGHEKVKTMLHHLKVIYVSHCHLDHHGGLASLLIRRREAFCKAGEKLPHLFLLLPDHNVIRYLDAMLNVCHKPLQDQEIIIENSRFLQKPRHMRTLISRVYDSLGLGKVDLCYTPHTKNSFGIALTHAMGWKITYSGDTRPSHRLIRIGMESDLLIHEATFEDDLLDLAIQNKHCTVSQAISSGREMLAKFTLLTHFSARYEVPVLKDCPNDVGIAFDNMVVTFDDLPYLPHLFPVFKELFFESLDIQRNKIYRRKHLNANLDSIS